MLQTLRRVWNGNVRRMHCQWLQVLREGRKGGARNLYIAGNINVELGLMCTDENGEEELTSLYGPMLARVRQVRWRFSKNLVVWDHERI